MLVCALMMQKLCTVLMHNAILLPNTTKHFESNALMATKREVKNFDDVMNFFFNRSETNSA